MASFTEPIIFEARQSSRAITIVPLADFARIYGSLSLTTSRHSVCPNFDSGPISCGLHGPPSHTIPLKQLP